MEKEHHLNQISVLGFKMLIFLGCISPKNVVMSHEFVVCRRSLTSRGPYRLLAHSSGGKPKKELDRGKPQGEGQGAFKQIVINYNLHSL